ncbi:hypothetical protein, partial [Cedecea sp. NFIX57]|uniref:hypothetical protein n=1 Tax=Cedecea sp. NFIX57 TaxID=1566286 RepID=UPI000A0B040B
TGASLSGDKLKVLYPGTVTVTGTDALDGYDNLVTTIVVPVNKKTSPALKAPANVTMTFGDKPRKTAAITDGNGSGTLHVWTDNAAVTARLTDRLGVELTALKVTKAPVAVTIEQESTADTTAPADVTFTVTVNPGTLPDLKPGNIDLNVGDTKENNSADNLKNVKGFLAGTKLTFSSDKTAIATVDKDTGKVTGISAGSATITVTETLDNYANKTEKFTVNVSKKVSPVLTTPANVTMTYDANPAKSVALSDAVGEGNGGPLSVTAAPSGVVTATLTSERQVKLTALKVPAGLVTITVSQAATPDTEAPKDVTFTVKVNKGAGGKNEERIPAVTAGNTVTLTMPLARTGSKITYVLTDAGTTGASLSGDKLKVLYPGTVTVTGTDALDGYDNVVTTIVVPVNKKTSPALTTPADVTMTYDADRAKSVATSDAVGEGNGGPLSVTA